VPRAREPRQQAGLLAVEGEPDPSATPQQQDPPGFNEQLDPKPDHGEHFYRGCRKLKTALHRLLERLPG